MVKLGPTSKLEIVGKVSGEGPLVHIRGRGIALTYIEGGLTVSTITIYECSR